MLIVFLGATLASISLIVYGVVAYVTDKHRLEPKQKKIVTSLKVSKEEVRNLDIIQDIKDNYRKPLPEPVDLGVEYSVGYGYTRLESYYYRDSGTTLSVEVNGSTFIFKFLIDGDYVKLPSYKGWTFKDLIEALRQVVKPEYLSISSVPSTIRALWTNLNFDSDNLSEEDVVWFINDSEIVCLALLSLTLNSKGFKVNVRYYHNVVCVEDIVYISPAQNTIYYEDYFFYKNYIEFVNNKFNTNFKVGQIHFDLKDEELKPTDNGLVITAV